MKYQLTGESYVIEGRGRVYLAVLEEDVPSDELSAAVGTSVATVDGERTVVGVERYAVHTQRKGWAIGLLVK